MEMKLMRGDKIHSSLQFQAWSSWDLRKDKRQTWGWRSLMRDIYRGQKRYWCVRQNKKPTLTIISDSVKYYFEEFKRSKWYVMLSHTKTNLNNSKLWIWLKKKKEIMPQWVVSVDVILTDMGWGHTEVSRTHCRIQDFFFWQNSFMNFSLVSPLRRSELLTPDLTI